MVAWEWIKLMATAMLISTGLTASFALMFLFF